MRTNAPADTEPSSKVLTTAVEGITNNYIIAINIGLNDKIDIIKCRCPNISSGHIILLTESSLCFPWLELIV